MSKLSESLKACLSAPHARPGVVAAPKNIRSVYESNLKEARTKTVGVRPWLALATATTMTMNSPESLTALHGFATSYLENLKTKKSPENPSVFVAEFMREVGLKCISFNGIARVINCLGGFYNSLPEETKTALSTEPMRILKEENIGRIDQQGRKLWKSIYDPYDNKLYNKLARSHPDLPIHIIYSHYGPLLANFPEQMPSPTAVGRVLTSIVAVACLRTQTGVGEQVISHIFGLRKAYKDGSHKEIHEQMVEGGKWLASDEGNLWLLKSVDTIVGAIGERSGIVLTPREPPKL